MLKAASFMAMDVYFGRSKIDACFESGKDKIVQRVISALQDEPDEETLSSMDLDTRLVFHTVYDAMVVQRASFKLLMDVSDIDKTVSECRHLSGLYKYMSNGLAVIEAKRRINIVIYACNVVVMQDDEGYLYKSLIDRMPLYYKALTILFMLWCVVNLLQHWNVCVFFPIEV